MLETGELREWNRVSNLQSLEMVPLKCESKVPIQGRSCELARNVYLPQTKASILRELVVMKVIYIDLNNYEVSKGCPVHTDHGEEMLQLHILTVWQ